MATNTVKTESRLIFHADVNSAFLSWESVRRLSEGLDDLRTVPSAIGGDKDKRTGVILAKSIPAKKYGIKVGEPVSMALRKCPSLVIAKPDFGLYSRSSKAFMKICRSVAPVVEQYSIDECFMDMTGTSFIYPDPILTANMLRERIKNELGFTVNIGIGPNKLLAKMASDFEKPDKVHTLFECELETKLWPLPVGELLYVGNSTAEKLVSYGIRTIGDAAKADIGFLQNIAGIRQGSMISRYANGLDSSPVQSEAPDAKGFSVSTTLEEDITDMERGESVLRLLSENLTERMRRRGFYAGCVGVTIRTNEFKNRSHQKTLRSPTDITEEIFETVSELFRELWDRETPLRLLGISLTGLTKEANTQLSLFDDQESADRKHRMYKSMDSIRQKYGNSAIRKASSMDADLEVGKKFKSQ